MRAKKIVQCHGNFDTFRCVVCGKKYALEECKSFILVGEIPYCVRGACKSGKKKRRRREEDFSDERDSQRGVLKPDITFFGEELPPYFYKTLQTDVDKADLVIIMGTSLKVGGSVMEFLKCVNDESPQVPIQHFYLP